MAALAASAPFSRFNPHVAGAACLALVLALGFVALVLLGDPTRAEPVARLALSGLEMPATASEPAPVVDPNTATDHPSAAPNEAIVRLRPSEDPHGPRLPGVETLSAHAPPPASSAEADRPVRTAAAEALAPAPIEALTAPGPGGVLPAISEDGRRVFDAYARPARPDGRPRVAMIVGGLGLSRETTQAAIDTLPAEVTLGFAPYAADLQRWIDAARAAGHEVVLELPMEPFDYPANDPGPHTLLAGAPAAENGRRLDWLMSRAAGYFAVMNYQGARFATSDAALRPILTRLRGRGVGLVFDGESSRTVIDEAAGRARLPFARADRIVDARPSRDAIDEQLLHLEALAIQNGDALGVATALPLSIEQIAQWTATLEAKGYALAPASAVLTARTEMRAQAGGRSAERREAPAGARSFATVRASFDERGAAASEDGRH